MKQPENEKKWKVFILSGEKDYKKAADFLECNFGIVTNGSTWTEEYLKWKLTDINPGGKGLLICAKYQDEIIGTLTLTKKRAKNNGSLIELAEIGDTYTKEEFRRAGMCQDLLDNEYLNRSVFGRLVYEALAYAKKNNINIVYGTPNNNSFPGYVSRLGFEGVKFTHSQSLKKHIKPTFRGIISKLGINKKNSNNSNQLTEYKYKKKNLIFHIKKIIASNNEINNLYTKLIQGRNIEFIRDYKYWTYRYIEHPIAAYEIRSIYLNEKFYGIFTYRIYRNEKNIQLCCIMDTMFCSNLIEINDVISIIKQGDNRTIDLIVYLNLGVDKRKSIYESISIMNVIQNNNLGINIEFNEFTLGCCDAA